MIATALGIGLAVIICWLISMFIAYIVRNPAKKVIIRNMINRDFVSELRKYESKVTGYANPAYISSMIGLKRKYLALRDSKMLDKSSIDGLVRDLIQIQIGYTRLKCADTESVKLMEEYKSIKI